MQDRFASPRPTFQAPTNASALEATTPRYKDTTPSRSVVERVEDSGESELAALLAQAQQGAREHATLASEHVRERLPRHERLTPIEDESVEEAAPVAKRAIAKFQPSDVLDDTTFIRRTRDASIHTPAVQALFWANGGEAHMVAGLTMAQAFDNLRREKMRKLQGAKAPTTPYQRHISLVPGAKVVTPGMPTQEDRIRQREGAVRATRIVANEKWAGIRK